LTTTIELEQRLHAAYARHEHDPHDLANVREVCDTLIALTREDELLPWADRALALGAQHPDFLAMRACALDLQGRHAEAVETRAHDPSMSSEPALSRLRLGYSLMMAGDLERAIPQLDEARQPSASATPRIVATAGHLLGEAMLKAADTRGFAHWLKRNESGDAASYRPVGVPEWAGESDLRDRRVLIAHQLGFGDNFLLAACVADWRAAGATVMITCDPQAHALLQASLPECDVVSAERPSASHGALPDAVQLRVEAFAPHLYATLLHLPLLSAAQQPSGFRFRPYMRAPHAKQQIAAEWARQLREQHPGKRLVGLFWDCYQRHLPHVGSTMRCWATRRSLPLGALNRIVTDSFLSDRIRFVNLHHPVTEAAAGAPAGDVDRYLPGIHFFDDTAACIGELDAVVAVDSAVANLAAMMGKPTCVPLNTSGDWRWGRHGTASPWVKGVTVLRQTHEGDWGPVVENAATWLAMQ
jgi:hypothetical protein